MNLKRIVVLELAYDSEIDGTPQDFRELPVLDAVVWATVVHDEFQGGAIEPAPGPDGEP